MATTVKISEKGFVPYMSIAEEARRLRILLYLWFATAVTYFGVAVPVIWDPAFHSFLIRDSTWTPAHLAIFGPYFAVIAAEAVIFQFYGWRKAQPYISSRLLPLSWWTFIISVFGFAFLTIGSNELGHIYIYREEFFSMPTHWTFVLTFMFIYATGVPEVARVYTRLAQLDDYAHKILAIVKRTEVSPEIKIERS